MNEEKPTNISFLGPSGVGKTPTGRCIKAQQTIEPHRVRPAPRDKRDTYYLSQAAHDGIRMALQPFLRKLAPEDTPSIEYYEHSLFFKVRGKDQALFVPHTLARVRKLEIFSPVMVKLLRHRVPSELFKTRTYMLLLNPWEMPIDEVDPQRASSTDFEEGRLVESFLQKRGESPNEIRDRLLGLAEEIVAWRALASASAELENFHFIDVRGWRHAEYLWQQDAAGESERAVASLREAVQKSLKDESHRAELLSLLACPAKDEYGSRRESCRNLWTEVSTLMDKVRTYRERASGEWGDSSEFYDRVLSYLGQANYEFSVIANLDE